LQQLLAGTNFSDTCAIFSMWYSFYRLLYPALSSDEVYRQMNNRLERSKNRTETIKMIIQTFLSLIKINIDDYTISGERTINPRAQHSIKIIKDTVDNITTFVTGDLKTMKKMLKFEMIANVDVQDKTSNNYTALMYKLLLGNITEIIWLLEKGANVDIQDRDGKSAIFFAIHNDDVFMVKHLLKYNPNLNIEDKSGHTPLTYAKMTKRKKIIPILEAAIKE
jgi:ankyrin repeat protein